MIIACVVPVIRHSLDFIRQIKINIDTNLVKGEKILENFERVCLLLGLFAFADNQ